METLFVRAQSNHRYINVEDNDHNDDVDDNVDDNNYKNDHSNDVDDNDYNG